MKQKLIIPNFLEEDEFEDLKKTILANNFSWFMPFQNLQNKEHTGDRNLSSNVENTFKDFGAEWFLSHEVYNNNVPCSRFFDKFIPLCNRITKESEISLQAPIRALIRIRVNFYPRTTTLIEHAMHVDYSFSHIGVVFAINTCNGYTKLLNDESKIESIANQALFFDSGEKHQSATTTNKRAKIVVIVNMI